MDLLLELFFAVGKSTLESEWADFSTLPELAKLSLLLDFVVLNVQACLLLLLVFLIHLLSWNKHVGIHIHTFLDWSLGCEVEDRLSVDLGDRLCHAGDGGSGHV